MGIGMLGLRVRFLCPLTALDVNEEHVRAVRVHTFPLAWLDGEALHDDLIVLEQILSRNIRVVEVLVLRLASRGFRGGWRYRLESHQVHLDRCRPRIGAALVGGIRGALPYDPTVSP